MHKPHDVRPFALHRVVFMGTWIKKENDKMKKAISILGSTGSIGTQSLEVARSHEMQIYALAANRNVDALEQQAREFYPKKVCIFETEKYAELKQRLADLPVQVLCGMEGLCDIASDKNADILINSVVGMVGLLPTLTAISAGLDIALANKETLVAGGIKSPYYYFAFESASARWTYKIDAVLGVIMDKTCDKIIPPAPEFIGLEKAKQIALEDAGLDETAQKIVFTREELSRNSGKPCYILEFYTDKCAYSYKVDAVSGEIIGKKSDWFSRQESETVPDTSQNSDSKQRRIG